MECFADKAKRLLSESGLSYRQVGERMGYDGEFARQSVYRFIHGRNPSAIMVKRFAEALGVEVKQLL